MDENKQQLPSSRPLGVSVIAVVNGIALVITILFWGMVFFNKLVPRPGELTVMSERANAATTYGFMIGDILYSAPLLFLAMLGVWRLRFWGWTAAQVANALWIYSMTIIFFRDAYTILSPGAVLFFPFPLFALWALWYLWKHRKLFI